MEKFQIFCPTFRLRQVGHQLTPVPDDLFEGPDVPPLDDGVGSQAGHEPGLVAVLEPVETRHRAHLEQTPKTVLAVV